MPGKKGLSGRKKCTLLERQVKNDKHKDRWIANPPDHINTRIEKFKDLGPIGQTVFELYEPMLYNNGTLSATDSISFYMLCKKYEDWYNLHKEVETKGRYENLFDRAGNPRGTVIAPWAKLEKEAFVELLKICREFGLTPVSRANVEKIQRGETTNPFEE